MVLSTVSRPGVVSGRYTNPPIKENPYHPFKIYVEVIK